MPKQYLSPPSTRARPGRLPGKLRRHWQRWAPFWVVAAALLAASEMLWLWQTSPVRELLSLTTGAAT